MSLLEELWEGLDALERHGFKEIAFPFIPLIICPDGISGYLFDGEIHKEMTLELREKIEKKHPTRIVSLKQMRNDAIEASEIIKGMGG